jgi:hypothetical protein
MYLTVCQIEQALRSLLEWLKHPEATVPLSKRDRDTVAKYHGGNFIV